MIACRAFEPSDEQAALLDAAIWGIWSAAVGYCFQRMPQERFEADNALTRLRAWEDDGRFWSRHLAIRSWKKWLPDAGAAFEGGFPKRRLRRRDAAYLRRFVAETRRAELVHWWVLFIWPVFLLWNPPWLSAIMLGYGLAANVPCLVTQRYNRQRLLRLLAHAGVPESPAEDGQKAQTPPTSTRV